MDRFISPTQELEATEPNNHKNNLKCFHHLSTLSPLTENRSIMPVSVAGLDTYGIRNTMFWEWLSLGICQLYLSLKFEELWLSCHTWKTNFYLSPLDGENTARLLQPSTLHKPLALEGGIRSFSTEDRKKKKQSWDTRVVLYLKTWDGVGRKERKRNGTSSSCRRTMQQHGAEFGHPSKPLQTPASFWSAGSLASTSACVPGADQELQAGGATGNAVPDLLCPIPEIDASLPRHVEASLTIHSLQQSLACTRFHYEHY